MAAAMLFIGSTASAQTRVFVSGSLFGDLKQPSNSDYFLERIDVSIFPPIYDFRETERLTTVSVLAGYHPTVRGRVRPGFAGGLSLIRDVTESGNLGVIPLDLSLVASEYVRNGPAATVAFEVAIDVARRLAIVPEIRATAYDATTVYRPGVAVRWELR
jgi:hypothetical protein